jgi:hypothetical protein
MIPRFTNENRVLRKLMFAVLMRTSERWSRVSVPELETKQLGLLLRKELGMDPTRAAEERGEKQAGERSSMTSGHNSYTGFRT